MERQFSPKLSGRTAVIGGLLVILLIACAYLFYSLDVSGMLKSYLESHIHPAVFIALMAILPVLGAPIVVFLVLVGMKFGIVAGILLSAVLMFFHLAVTYYLVHSFLRDWISRLLRRFNVSVPIMGVDYGTWHAVIFAIVPGVPYAVKNNLMALAGVPFVPYMVINWTIHYGMGIPYIVLGSAAIEMDLAILGIGVVLLLVGWFLLHCVRKKFLSKSERRGGVG